MSLGSLTPYDTETYGSDTTYYLATTEDVQPTPAPQPDARLVDLLNRWRYRLSLVSRILMNSFALVECIAECSWSCTTNLG